MSAKKIKELIENYYEVDMDEQYNRHMAYKSKGKSRLEYEEQADHSESILYTIAEKIKALSPSDYMKNKYPELVDILETI